MKKKFKIRHNILEKLFERYSCTPDVSHISEISLTWTQLVNFASYSETEIGEQIQYLINQNEIKEKEEDMFVFFYSISNIGIASYHDNKYLDEGEKESRDRYFNKIRNWSMTILLLIAVITFISNIFIEIKNNLEVENLKKELDILKIEIQKRKNE